MDSDSSPMDTLSRRIAFLRKQYAKGLGHRPSALQSAAILRAARLTALAEAAACNPNHSANDVVRLDGAACRARRDMAAAIAAARPSPKLGPDSLREYAASKYASAT